MKDTLRQSIVRVADALVQMLERDYENFEPEIGRWDWMPGVGLYGLVRAYETLAEKRYLEFCKAYVDRLLAEDIVSYSINGSILFETVLKLYEYYQAESYQTELRYFLRWLLRSAAKCQNQCYEHSWTEQDVHLVEQVWIDTLYMVGIVLAESYRLLGREDCRDEALLQFLRHQQCLQDPETGLFRHLYECSTGSHLAGAFWGRGNGWMAASVVDLLSAIGGDDPRTRDIVESFRRQMEAVRRVQDSSGMFHTILTDPNTYLEMSSTAALGYAALRGVRLGALEAHFKSVGERAVEAVLAHIKPDGIVDKVSGGTSGFIEYEEYNLIPIGPCLYGQALAIMLLSEYLTMSSE